MPNRPAGLPAALPWWPHSRSALHGSGHAAQPPKRASSCPSAPLQSCPWVGEHSRKGLFACCWAWLQCCPQEPAQYLLALQRSRQSIHSSHVSTCLFVYSSDHESVSLFVCLSVHHTANHLFVCLPVHLCICLPFYPSTCLSVHHPSVHPSVCLSCLFVCLCVCCCVQAQI